MEVLWTCYETLSEKVQPFADMKCAIEFLNIYLLDSDLFFLWIDCYIYPTFEQFNSKVWFHKTEKRLCKCSLDKYT